MIEVVATAAPGIDDIVVLGKIKQLERSGDWDTIVVDGPAAGHAVTFLTSARGLHDVVRGGPVRTQADEVLKLLGDPKRCQVVLVTIPEATPVNEVVETAYALEERVGVQLGPVVVNGIDTGHDLPDEERCDELLAGGLADFARRDTARDPRRRRRGSAVPGGRCSAAEIERLADQLALPQVHLPFLPVAGVDEAGGTHARRPADGRGRGVIGRPATPRGSRGTRRCRGGGLLRVGRRRQDHGRRGAGDPGRPRWRACGGGHDRSRAPSRRRPRPARRTRRRAPADRARRAGELWAMMLDTAATFDGLVQQYAADAEQATRILENPFYRNIAGALSGTQEYMAAETLHQLHNDERFDRVIVDTPPSRNALDFLEAPGVLARFLDHRLFKLLMLPARRGMKVFNVATQPVLRTIGKVVGSDVLADAVAFFQAFAGMEGGFRERAEDVLALLRSDVTRFVLVASPRHDTIAEATWFADQLARQSLAVAAAVVNRAHPRFGDWEPARRRQGGRRRRDGRVRRPGRPVAQRGGDRRDRRRRGEVAAPLAERVGDAPLVEVPLLEDDVHDTEALERIRSVLFDGG